MSGAGQLLEGIQNQPAPPCDNCEFHDACAELHLACRRFSYYVHIPPPSGGLRRFRWDKQVYTPTGEVPTRHKFIRIFRDDRHIEEDMGLSAA